MNQTSDEKIFLAAAGWLAILSGIAWIGWAALNVSTHGLLDAPPPAESSRLYKLGEVLSSGWNLLLVPAALALWSWLRGERPKMALLYTLSGVLSLCFWAYGGATHGITPGLECTYLLLGAAWWLGIGSVLRQERKSFGIFTMVLGAFTLLDGVFTLLEPLPHAVYMLAAPKLPLAVVWSFWVGSVLVSRARRLPAALAQSA